MLNTFCSPCRRFLNTYLDESKPLPTRTCGGGTFEVPVVGVGCWSFGSRQGEYWGHQPQALVADTVRAALDYGSAFFDTAEALFDGRSETSLGDALSEAGDVAERAIISSKILPSNCSPPGKVREHLVRSLARLKVGSIFLYQVHWPLGSGSVAAVFAELAELQREGKIVHIGVSNFGVKQLTEALDTGATIATNQVMYNLLSRSAEHEVMKWCAAHDVGIICYSPLMQGLLTDEGSVDALDAFRTRTRHFSGARYNSRHKEAGVEDLVHATVDRIQAIARREGRATHELALAWCLTHPEVVCVIPGARNREQLDSNMSVAFDPISDALRAELDNETEALKDALGPHIDFFAGKRAQRSF